MKQPPPTISEYGKSVYFTTTTAAVAAECYAQRTL